MILHHYTIPANALLIGFAGLEPGCKDGNQWQTLGVPIVWLTKEESNLATAADVERYPDARIGDPRYGGPVQCTVEIERSKHVMRYAEFLRTTKIVAVNSDTGRQSTGRDVLRLFEAEPYGPAVLTSWWICTRAIPASKIWVPLTRAQAIEACEWHAKTHPKADARERFKQQRDTFTAEPDNTVFIVHDGQCGRGQAMERAP